MNKKQAEQKLRDDAALEKLSGQPVTVIEGQDNPKQAAPLPPGQSVILDEIEDLKAAINARMCEEIRKELERDSWIPRMQPDPLKWTPRRYKPAPADAWDGWTFSNGQTYKTVYEDMARAMHSAYESAYFYGEPPIKTDAESYASLAAWYHQHAELFPPDLRDLNNGQTFKAWDELMGAIADFKAYHEKTGKTWAEYDAETIILEGRGNPGAGSFGVSVNHDYSQTARRPGESLKDEAFRKSAEDVTNLLRSTRNFRKRV